MAADFRSNGANKAGGVSLIITAALLVTAAAGSLLLEPSPPSASQTEAALRLAAAMPALFTVVLAAFIAAAIFLVPSALALFEALKAYRRTRILMATGFALVAIAIFLTKATSLVSMIFLGNEYAAATTDAERDLIVARADLVGLTTEAGFDLFNLLLGAWVILVGLAMRHGPFPKAIAYAGIVVGFFPAPPLTATMAGTDQEFVFSYFLRAAWFFVTGIALFRLRRGTMVVSTDQA